MLSGNLLLLLAVFVSVSSLVLLVWALVGGEREAVERRLIGNATRLEHRKRYSSYERPQAPLPRIGAALLPDDEVKAGQLNSQVRQAGLYRQHSAALYLGVKCVMMVSPMGVGLGLSALGVLTMASGVIFGTIVGLLGSLVPPVWLRRRKLERRACIRRALPDALDVIVVCLEGGLSLPASFARVADELKDAHPMLAREMGIVRRELQLGRTTGEALHEFANRFDAEELRSLSSVINQAEKFGASIVKALRVHADTLRLKRYQHAEAQAQRAPVKLIFPTVLCIFPALYIVLMGPAAVQLMEMLDTLSR